MGSSSGGGGSTVDYGTWDGGSAGEAVPIQGSSGNIDAGTFDGSGQGGVDWQKVLKAAQQLGDGGSGQGQGVQNIPGAALPGLRPNTGVPAHAGALTALLQMLNQRRDMYLNAATNPRAGVVQQPPPGPGLLGV
jgi:hypothetical protein